MNDCILPPETLICPGHGPLTTVAEEKEHTILSFDLRLGEWPR